MKIEMTPKLKPVRGGEVRTGNVYELKNGGGYFVVVNVCKSDRKYNNVVMLRINTSGEIISGLNEPEVYVKNHKNLVGFIKDMPSLKIEWLDASNSNT